jgi:hypothetical protein
MHAEKVPSLLQVCTPSLPPRHGHDTAMPGTHEPGVTSPSPPPPHPAKLAVAPSRNATPATCAVLESKKPLVPSDVESIC